MSVTFRPLGPINSVQTAARALRDVEAMLRDVIAAENTAINAADLVGDTLAASVIHSSLVSFGILAADLLFVDATYDIGKAGATRPRDGFFSRNVVIGGTLDATRVIRIQTGGNAAILGGATGVNDLINGSVQGDLTLRVAATQHILFSVDSGTTALAAMAASGLNVNALLTRTHAAGTEGWIADITAGLNNTVMGCNDTAITSAASGALAHHSFFGSLNNYPIDIVTNASRVATFAFTGIAFTNSLTVTAAQGITITNPTPTTNIRFLNVTGSTTATNYMQIASTGGNSVYGIESSAGGTLGTGTTAYSTVLGSSAASALHFTTSAIVRLTIDSAGAVSVAGTLNVSGLLDLAATGLRIGGVDAGVFTSGGSIFLAKRSTGAGLSIDYSTGSASFSGSVAIVGLGAGTGLLSVGAANSGGAGFRQVLVPN